MEDYIPLCDRTTTFPEIKAFRLAELGACRGEPEGASHIKGEWSEPLVEIHDGSTRREQTCFRAGYDEQGIYFLIRCDEPSMATLKAETTESSSNLFADDNVRVCIDPWGDGERCYHFVMNTLGATIQLREDWGVAWQGEWKGQVKREDDSWTARLFIPWSTFELDERVSDTWRVNVYRARQAAGESCVGWSPTFAAYHSPARFGYVKGLDVDFKPFMQCGEFEVVDLVMDRRGDQTVLTYTIDYHSADGKPVEVAIDDSQLDVLAGAVVQLEKDNDQKLQRLKLELSAALPDEYDGYRMESAVLLARSRSGRSARLGLSCTLPFTELGPLEPLEHPFLFLTKKGVAELRERAAHDDRTKQAMKQVFDLADEFVEAPPELPTKTGVFIDHYICRKHGAKLKWDRKLPHEHVCPIDQEVYQGDVYDDAWRTLYHGDVIDRMRYVSIAYLVSQDPEYARAIRKTLLQYAQRYEGYPLYGQGGLTKGGLAPTTGARIGCETHHDAHYLGYFAMAYDFTVPSGLYTREDRDMIEKNLFPAMIKVVQRYNADQNNWQVSHNVGLAIAAVLLRDTRLLHEVLNGRTGFHFHMGESVMPGGFFYEETLGYHTGVTHGFVQESIVLLNSGVDVRRCPGLKDMVDFVVSVSDSYGLLPALGDGHPDNISSLWPMFTLAEWFWGGYGALADPPESIVSDEKPSLDWLLYGKRALASDVARESHSTDLAGSKIAVLGGTEAQLLAHFGNAGGHAHNDAMAITMNYGGQRILIDSGSIGYANRAYRSYYKETLAHNALLVDQENSSAAGADRTLFVADGAVKVLQMQSDRLFPGVRQERLSLLIDDRFLVDFITANSDRQRCYDYVLHFEKGQLAPGEGAKLTEGDVGRQGAYEFLDNVKLCTSQDKAWWRHVSEEGQHTLVALRSLPNGSTFVAQAPGITALVPPTAVILERTLASEATFVSVTLPGLSEGEASPEIRFICEGTDSDDNTVGVEMDYNGSKHVVVSSGNGSFQWGPYRFTGEGAYLRLDPAGKAEMIFLICGRQMTAGDRTWRFSRNACVEIVNPTAAEPEVIVRNSDGSVEIIAR